MENEEILEEATVEETAENTENNYLLIAGVVAGVAAIGFTAYKLGKPAIARIKDKIAGHADSETEGVEEEEK